jgi:hypothetical protein
MFVSELGHVAHAYRTKYSYRPTHLVKYSSNCIPENIKVIYSLVSEDATRSASSNETLCWTKQVKCMASGLSSLKTSREEAVKTKHCVSD